MICGVGDPATISTRLASIYGEEGKSHGLRKKWNCCKFSISDISYLDFLLLLLCSILGRYSFRPTVINNFKTQTVLMLWRPCFSSNAPKWMKSRTGRWWNGVQVYWRNDVQSIIKMWSEYVPQLFVLYKTCAQASKKSS